MKHIVLFTGHMIDAPGRDRARFPVSKEAMVTQAVNDCLLQETNDYGACTGIAGAACGGDIIFHECCQATGIPSEIILAEPVNDFKKNSVSFAGVEWEIKFDKLLTVLPVSMMEKPSDPQANIWEAANMLMLAEALKHGSEHATLIALWDGKGGDGPGGTEHLVNAAQSRGVRVQIIDITAF